MRQTVYQGLTESRRAWLHERVARHLLGSRPPAPADELALHFHRAGADNETRLYATDAADRAEASGAIPEALRFLRVAREHSHDPGSVADLLGRMGHLNYLHQNLEEAAPLLELAAQRFRRQGEKARALRAEVERIDCLAQTGEHLGKDCLEELQLIKEEAISDERWEVFQDALNVEAHHLDREGDLTGVRSVLAQAQASLNQGTLKARCKARAMVALNIYFGSPEEGLKAAQDAVAIAKKISDSKLLLHALNRLIVVLHYQGKLQTSEGLEALSEAESQLGDCGDLILKFHVRLNKAVWHLEIGDLDIARTGLDAAGNLVRGTQAHDAKAMLHLNIGELGLASHDFELAKISYEDARKLITTSSPHFFPTLATAGLGLCNLQVGELGEAQRRESELPEFPNFWTYDPTIFTLFKARMLMKRRDTSKALSILRQTRQKVQSRFIPAWLRLTLEEANILKNAQPAEAAILAREGLTVADSLDLRERSRQFRRLKESLK